VSVELVVELKKAEGEDDDPTTLAGLLFLEALMVKALLEATESAREEAVKSLLAVVSDLPTTKISFWQRQTLRKKIDRILTKLRIKLVRLSAPVIHQMMSRIAKESAELTGAKHFAQLVTTSFRDASQIANLSRSQMLFFSKHFDADISLKARDIVVGVIKDNVKTPEKVRGILSTKLGKVIDQSESYFEVFTTNALNTARSFANLRTFQKMGVTKFMIEAVIDSRTSDICLDLDQKTFFVQTGINQMEKMANATSVEDIQNTSPWIHQGEDGYYIERNGSQVNFNENVSSSFLSGIGVTFPPYHARCRSTVVPVEEL